MLIQFNVHSVQSNGINLLPGHSPEKQLLFHMDTSEQVNDESHHFLEESERQIIVFTVSSTDGNIFLMCGIFDHNLCINTGVCGLLHTYLCLICQAAFLLWVCLLVWTDFA